LRPRDTSRTAPKAAITDTAALFRLNPEFKAMWRDNDVRGYGEGVRTDRASKGAVAFVPKLAQGQLRRPTHLRDQYRVPIRQLRTE